MDDKRLIEDYLPIEAISAEASREKSVRKGHISTLHLWWARRPLVACRAAVYGALVPASRFDPANGPENKKKSLGRANAAKFVERLCKYPGDPRVIAEAQRHILEAHADRLTAELAEARATDQWPGWVEEFKWPRENGQVTREDIEAGRAPRPRVLDPFAGGGAIPLEALRLGCEAYANDLNPVAHIIELCTLVYPQKYGKPDANVRGMTGPKNAKGETTWGGLAQEVRYWGQWVLEKVRAEIGDLYPPIPDPDAKPEEIGADPQAVLEFAKDAQGRLTVPHGYLTPVAYLWTRTVKCKRPDCGGIVPLARQTWLCRKENRGGGRYIAVNGIWDTLRKRVRYSVVHATSPKSLGFDPSDGSRSGTTVCPGCQSQIDDEYVKAEGSADRFGYHLMAVVCDSGANGRRYVNPNPDGEQALLSKDLLDRAETLAAKLGISVPDEPLEANPRSFDVQHFGFTHWRKVFLPRQLVAMVAFAGVVRSSYSELLSVRCQPDQARAVATCLAMVLGRLANQCTSLCRWQPEFIAGMLGDAGLPMVMDFAEVNALADSSGGWPSALNYTCAALKGSEGIIGSAVVARGSAVKMPWGNEAFDAVITDPPYYDSRSYSNLSDHFYVWHKRAVGHLYPQHFVSQLTPKKTEAIAAPYRHEGVRADADTAYEGMMLNAFHQARQSLKPGAPMVCVYAHKTTAGWTTLINALRIAGYFIDEAWPVEMERKVRQNALETAALASSILLVARRRSKSTTGSYDDEVRLELERIVRERVATLWDMGISGADLVISSVGAGLRAFTRHASVEYANGEEVPAERFLTEVETVVLESILNRLSKEVGGNGNKQTSLAGVDSATRFYLLWRYTYRWAELDAGEAIVFANGTHVELEGQGSLSQGTRALVEKKKAKYRLRDFLERGDDDKLGLPGDNGTPAPLVDALHRTLWLMEKRPRELPEFLKESSVNREQMRLVAQALAGPALKGGELGDVSPTAELAALSKLTANWRSVIEDADVTATQREDRRAGQRALFGKDAE